MIIYLIFSQDGYEEVKQELISQHAMLWVNNSFLSDKQLTELKQYDIDVNVFSESINGSHDKSIMQALLPIEKQYPDAEILVEYL